MLTAVHILNRSPTKALDGMTPYEAWNGRKPAVAHLRIFGYLTYVKELSHVGELDDRSTLEVFIGYAEGVKAYRILDSETQRVCMARDVVFDEGRGWAWGKMVDDSLTSTYDNFTINYVHFEGVRGVDSSSSRACLPQSTGLHPLRRVLLRLRRALHHHHHHSRPRCTLLCRHLLLRARLHQHWLTMSIARWSSPLRSLDEDHVNAYHDGEPLRYCTMEDILSDQPVPGLIPHDLEAELHLAYDDGEPRSFAKAEGHAAWRAAMKLEMEAAEKNRA
ncbi:hypothetical protein SEVIR_7G116650v4 [Setaria viridis]